MLTTSRRLIIFTPNCGRTFRLVCSCRLESIHRLSQRYARELRTPLTLYGLICRQFRRGAGGRKNRKAPWPDAHVSTATISLNKPLPSQLTELYGCRTTICPPPCRKCRSSRDRTLRSRWQNWQNKLSFGYNKYQFLWRRRAMYQLLDIFRAAALLNPLFPSIPQKGDRLSPVIRHLDGLEERQLRFAIKWLRPASVAARV